MNIVTLSLIAFDVWFNIMYIWYTTLYIWYPNLLWLKWKRTFRYIYVASSSSMGMYPTLGGSVWSGTERVITLKRLNWLKDYERCIPIAYHISDFVQQVKTKCTMQQPYMLPILYSQYHACWCPGDSRSQGISGHGIDHIRRNIPSLATEELTGQDSCMQSATIVHRLDDARSEPRMTHVAMRYPFWRNTVECSVNGMRNIFACTNVGCVFYRHWTVCLSATSLKYVFAEVSRIGRKIRRWITGMVYMVCIVVS